MHMTKLKKLGAGLLVIAFAASCSIATSMDATIDREIEAATKLKEDSKIPTAPSNEDLIKVKDEIWLGDTSGRIRRRPAAVLFRDQERHYLSQQPSDYFVRNRRYD